MTAYERRLQAELERLEQLAALNPERLDAIGTADRTLLCTLRRTPAALAGDLGLSVSNHAVRIVYPPYFPAVPMEAYLTVPVSHPNIHPETGFVCLWETHRVTNTVEHALHKLVAMLAGNLYNSASIHIMQPDALRSLQARGSKGFEPLRGIEHDNDIVAIPASRRTRLS